MTDPTNPIRILCVAGARPNFMKVAPLFRAFANEPRISATLVHTGQHSDESMSGRFFRELGLPAARHNLGIGRGSHAQQTAEILLRFEPVLIEENPSAVLVVGDVNSTLACALAAKKLKFFVIHVEAGLRSFDRAMPEEINRVATDAISDLLLVSEESGMRNLEKEGAPPERVCLVGNLMIDSLHYHLPQARKSSVLRELGLHGQRFGLVTLHRSANVDDTGRLREILGALREISASLPLIFPVHPRTRAHLQNQDAGPRIRVIDPLGYLDFLCLMSNSALALTDSGGVQEETAALGIPCLTLRNHTERPATLEPCSNRLAGTTRESILRAWNELPHTPAFAAIPQLWDGAAAGRCVDAIRGVFERGG